METGSIQKLITILFWLMLYLVIQIPKYVLAFYSDFVEALLRSLVRYLMLFLKQSYFRHKLILMIRNDFVANKKLIYNAEFNTYGNHSSYQFISLPCLSQTHRCSRKGRKSELRRRIWIQTTIGRSLRLKSMARRRNLVCMAV